MKLKKDIVLAQTIAKSKMNEAKRNGNKELEEYCKGLFHALNWICWDKKLGTEDLPIK